MQDMGDIRKINLMYVAFKSLHIHANRKEYLVKRLKSYLLEKEKNKGKTVMRKWLE
jgi:hypothetical protein